jgi:branched-chain amino acid transport system ATP-binding protein
MTPPISAPPADPRQTGGDLLSITGLYAGWGGLAVVRDVDMRIGPGEIVALLGPNGAGKTTVLKTVAGLLPVIKGEIQVLGRAPSVRRPHTAPRRGLAYVPDDRCLFRSLTTRQNLALAARRGEISAVYEYLPELRGLIDRQAGLLSGGEQQMLAIARALLMRPRLLMIDELSMGLAPVIVTRLLDVVHDVSRSLGISVLIVEQHVRMALDIADRAYVLNHGRLTAYGTAAELDEQIDAIEAGYLGGDARN